MAGPLTGPKVDALQGRASHLGLVFQQFIFNPLAPSTTAIVSAVEPSAAGVLLTHTIAAQPDRPRAISMTVTDANSSITGFVGTIYGTDFWGEPQTEVIRKTSLGTATVNGNLAFRTINKITSLVVSGTVSGGADTVSYGRIDKFGLAARIGSTADVLSVLEGELEGGSGAAVDALAVDAATISAQYHTFDPVVVANGVLDFVVEIRSTYSEV